MIGRDEDAEVRLVDPRASRHHARIITGQAIEIEDLGSANGTVLRDQALEAGKPKQLQTGDVIVIGSTMMILCAGEPDLEVGRVWAHEYLETRLVEECARAASSGSEFALARVRVEGQPPPILVEQVVADVLREGDLLASYAPSDYEVLLLGRGEIEARGLPDAIVAALAARGITSRCQLAIYPADGTSPQALVGRASEWLGLRQAAGTNRAGVVVENPVMRDLYALAERAARGSSSVLILGETGAGKEVLAETVHRASPRAEQPFVALNCAALSESLVESELFGFERGAFTGAHQAKIGLLEAASGGTLFLDEIGEMPLAIQAKLLRAIETRQVLRIGATKARLVDVRFVAATNRDLDEEVAEKRFREDLYFRLNVITLEIPPLRERPEEIGTLARLFLDRVALAVGRPAPSLSDEALSMLESYAWPGNIRELRNVIERAFVLCVGGVVGVEHLPADKIRRNPRTQSEVARGRSASIAVGSPVSSAIRGGIKDIERQAIVDALERCHWNQTRAAELLGMPRRTFCKRMKEYDIPRPRA
jgi:two-component system response regulator AtoC